MRFMGRSLIALFLLAVTLGLLGMAGATLWGAIQDRMADDASPQPSRERVFSVNVVTATPETVTPELRVFGEIRAARVLELRTPAAGTIVTLADGFVEGGRVTAGQVLLRIDPAEADAALATARNDLAEAEADARDAARLLVLAREEVAAAAAQADLRSTALQRQKDLAARGVGTDAAVETAELALAAARQAVLTRRQAEASAEARVDQSATALERRRIVVAEAARKRDQTDLSAEFTGTLSEVTALAGGRVSANERIARLIDPTQLEVALRLSTSQHARLLHPDGTLRDAPVRAVLDVLGLDVEATGRIIREAPAVGAGQTGRLVFATLSGAGGFRPGDFVEVRVQEPAMDGIVRLPATALSAQSTVLVLDADGTRLEEMAVTLERRQGDTVLVRASPDLTGREVVAERTPLLGAGIKVRPLRRDGAQGSAPGSSDLIPLTPERRAAMIAYVNAAGDIPDDVKTQMLDRLAEDVVPAAMVARIESRMGS